MSQTIQLFCRQLFKQRVAKKLEIELPLCLLSSQCYNNLDYKSHNSVHVLEEGGCCILICHVLHMSDVHILMCVLSTSKTLKLLGQNEPEQHISEHWTSDPDLSVFSCEVHWAVPPNWPALNAVHDPWPPRKHTLQIIQV